MTTNLAPWDRWVRVVLGLGLLATAWYTTSVWPLIAGIVLLWTAIAGWCLLYRLFRVSTRRQLSSALPQREGFAPVARRAVEQVAAGKAALLDVRNDDEWAAGHAPMALHLELSKLEAGQLPDIPKDRPVFVHCAAGGRAGVAVGILTKGGWERVSNLGGLNDWKEAGGAVVTE